MNPLNFLLQYFCDKPMLFHYREAFERRTRNCYCVE